MAEATGKRIGTSLEPFSGRGRPHLNRCTTTEQGDCQPQCGARETLTETHDLPRNFHETLRAPPDANTPLDSTGSCDGAPECGPCASITATATAHDGTTLGARRPSEDRREDLGTAALPVSICSSWMGGAGRRRSQAHLGHPS